MSRRVAAGRFGVSVSSVIHWDAVRRIAGDFAPKRQGGDTRSRRIETRPAIVMVASEAERDQSLDQLRAPFRRARRHRLHLGLVAVLSAVSHWRAIGPSDDGERLKRNTYGPPRWQVGCCWLGSVVRKRVRHGGALAVAMLEIRASRSS